MAYDPYFNYVTLLLTGNGPNNSQKIYDISPLKQTITVSGNAKISTLDSKSGGSSIYLDGVSGTTYLTVPTSVFAFGLLDFTIEFWINLASPASMVYPYIIASAPFDSGSGFFIICNGASTGWATTGNISFNTSNTINYGVNLVSTSVVRGAGWKHIAVCRRNVVHQLYINGVLEAEAVTLGITNYSPTTSRIGCPSNSATGNEKGYMDNLRVTVGACRYTSNFTPTVYAESGRPQISYDATYTYITFNDSGNFYWDPTSSPEAPTDVDILIIGGGGSGGSGAGGGGGAGELITGTIPSLPTGDYEIVIGKGGAVVSSDAAGNNGEDTAFYGMTAVGGGGGGGWSASAKAGGSGGGVGCQASSGYLVQMLSNKILYTGYTVYGNSGGAYIAANGAGGGGAGQVGNTNASWRGGDGIQVWGTWYAGGGGGGGSGTLGGLGGGGTGGTAGSGQTAGAANTGSGGGGSGGGAGYTSGAGGSGVVKIRFMTSLYTYLGFTGVSDKLVYSTLAKMVKFSLPEVKPAGAAYITQVRLVAFRLYATKPVLIATNPRLGIHIYQTGLNFRVDFPSVLPRMSCYSLPSSRVLDRLVYNVYPKVATAPIDWYNQDRMGRAQIQNFIVRVVSFRLPSRLPTIPRYPKPQYVILGVVYGDAKEQIGTNINSEVNDSDFMNVFI
jgi:hypothetical protein